MGMNPDPLELNNRNLIVSSCAIIGFLLCMTAGCGQWRSTAPAAAKPAGVAVGPGKPAVQVKEYALKGVVKRLDARTGQVTIRHEAIPGFMNAMTMPFTLKDRAALDDIKPGDSVDATLRVTEVNGAVNDYELLNLAVVARASRPMVLDISRGKVQLRERPRQLEVGDTVPDFAMTTQEGKVVKLSELRGNVVALTFIYTRCPIPDFCPLMDRKFADLAQKASTFRARSQHNRLISLSFDPEHDKPDILRKHAQIRGATPPLWTYAVATHDELDKIAAPLGLMYEPGTNEIAHNLSTAVIDPQGKLARLDVGKDRNRWETSDMLKTIYALLRAAGK